MVPWVSATRRLTGAPTGKVALVTAGDSRHGRRDNGLAAAEYAPAGDVDPRVGEHLLDVLALKGIAAYLRPTTDLNPITRSTSLPKRPTDRLYVDRSHLEIAREYLRRLAEDAADDELAEPTGRDKDGPRGENGQRGKD